jgi:hypothetical protein
MSLGSMQACHSDRDKHVACHHINQSKLPAIKSIQVAMHACHADPCKHVTRIEACRSMPPHKSIQVASHQINPSCHARMELGSIHACHSDRCKHVTRIVANMWHATTYINQSKLPAIKSIEVAMHARLSDRCKHVTRIDASMSLGSMQACHSDRGMLQHATT